LTYHTIGHFQSKSKNRYELSITSNIAKATHKRKNRFWKRATRPKSSTVTPDQSIKF